MLHSTRPPVHRPVGHDREETPLATSAALNASVAAAVTPPALHASHVAELQLAWCQARRVVTVSRQEVA